MEIQFRKFTAIDLPLLKPVPAISALPQWYKEMSPFTEGKKPKFFIGGGKNVTVKRCNPFGDAISAGYFLLLENSIYVEASDAGVPRIIWHRGGEKFISEHSQSQISADIAPEGFSIQPFKFQNDWSIQTPKGYSVLVTHPMNRNNEVFLTLSGVVDTDTFHQAIQLPFLIRKDFTGVIEAGTPIAQVFPFKRENWKSKMLNHDSNFYAEKYADFLRIMNRYYKRFHWNRKEYK